MSVVFLFLICFALKEKLSKAETISCALSLVVRWFRVCDNNLFLIWVWFSELLLFKLLQTVVNILSTRMFNCSAAFRLHGRTISILMNNCRERHLQHNVIKFRDLKSGILGIWLSSISRNEEIFLNKTHRQYWQVDTQPYRISYEEHDLRMQWVQTGSGISVV